MNPIETTGRKRLPKKSEEESETEENPSDGEDNEDNSFDEESEMDSMDAKTIGYFFKFLNLFLELGLLGKIKKEVRVLEELGKVNIFLIF